jgi:hypothetical protein
VVAEQHARLVTREHPPSGGERDAERAPVGVRVERDRQVRLHAGGQLQQGVGGAGLLRVGEGHRRERRVGRGLGRDHVHVGEARPMQGEHGRLAADAVQRGQRDAQPAGPAARQPGDPVQVGLAHVDGSGGDADRHGHRGRRGGDRGLDLGVGGWGELGAALLGVETEVDLVAVVRGWVVRRRDLHPGHRVERADGEGQ